MAEDTADESHGGVRVGDDVDEIAVEQSPGYRKPPQAEDTEIDADDGQGRSSGSRKIRPHPVSVGGRLIVHGEGIAKPQGQEQEYKRGKKPATLFRMQLVQRTPPDAGGPTIVSLLISKSKS